MDARVHLLTVHQRCIHAPGEHVVLVWYSSVGGADQSDEQVVAP